MLPNLTDFFKLKPLDGTNFYDRRLQFLITSTNKYFSKLRDFTENNHGKFMQTMCQACF